MIKIYFDEILIDEDSYANLTNDYKLFTDNFYLGSTASNTFKLSVAKTAVSSHPAEVKITDDTKTYYLLVDKVTDEKNFYIYDLVDKLVLFNFNYDASVLIADKLELEEATHLSDILADMCSQVGVTVDETLTLINDIEVTWYDNTLLARDYLSFIAELQGGYAKILDNGKLTIVKHKMTSQATLQIDSCEDFVVGERKQITRVVYDNGVAKYEYGLDSGNTLYINPNNVFITETETVLNIYNEVVGLEFYLIDTGKCQLDPSVRAGDIITFTDGTNSYPTIAGYSASYGGGNWLGNYSLNIESKQQEETQTIGIDSKIKSIKTEIDRTNASLKITADKTEDNESYISSIQLTPEEIRLSVSKVDELDEDINDPATGLSKKYGDLSLDVAQLRSEIGDVTDITTQEEGSGTLEFESINTSEPINITIRPTADKDISYLYPSSRLFPSSSLFPRNRILRFYNSTEDETIDYTLPGNLRYLNSTTYDEFFLDFATNTCKIIRKVAIAEDMTKSALAVPVEETYTYPNIPLSAGNYTVTMLGYPNAYMKIRLMSQNMYTSQFATRVELSSAITQSATAINLEVAKKTDKTAIISTINQTAEAIKIQASKIDITGTLTAINNDTSTTIDGDKITTGSITASQVSSAIITTTNFSAQNINADKITAGTLNGTNVNITNLNASNITGGTISADKINGGTISGSSINLGSGTFTVNTSGVMSATGATVGGTINATSGYLGGTSGWNIQSGYIESRISGRIATLYSDGRIMVYKNTRLNVGDEGAVLSGSGSSYRCVVGDEPSNYGSASGLTTALSSVTTSTGANVVATVGMVAHNGPILIRNRFAGSNGAIKIATSTGTININAGNAKYATSNGSVMISGTNNITLESGSTGSIYLDATTSGGVYARGYSSSSYQLVQAGGVYVSSKNIKENLIKFENKKYDNAIKLLKGINIYEYDYKYDVSPREHTFGFIIDEIEKIDKDNFFEFSVDKDVKVKDKALVYNADQYKDNYDEIIDIKRYDPSVLDKYLLTVCKAQQMKIDELEQRLEKIERK